MINVVIDGTATPAVAGGEGMTWPYFCLLAACKDRTPYEQAHLDYFASGFRAFERSED